MNARANHCFSGSASRPGPTTDMLNVDNAIKIISPFCGTALGLVTTTETGKKLKGLLDSLDKRRP